jgi:flagellar hook-associated protein 2
MQLHSNDLNEFLPGVNLHLKAAKPGQPFMIRITEDYEKVTSKLKEVVNQINGILDFINKQNQIDEKSDTRTTFAGDTSLQSMEFRIRNLLHEAFPIIEEGSDEIRLMWMSDLGIEFNRSGQLTMNEKKLQQMMEKDFYGVAEAIAGEKGFAAQMRSVFATYTRPGSGLLATREQGLKRRLNEIDRQIEQKERIIERRAASLTEQFSRLQSTLGNMQQQQQYVAASLGATGGNPITQLLG